MNHQSNTFHTFSSLDFLLLEDQIGKNNFYISFLLSPVTLWIFTIYIIYVIYYIYIVISISYIFHILYLSNLITSIRVSEETKRELIKIGGELIAKDGIERSMEDILKMLIKLYRKK